MYVSVLAVLGELSRYARRSVTVAAIARRRIVERNGELSFIDNTVDPPPGTFASKHVSNTPTPLPVVCTAGLTLASPK